MAFYTCTVNEVGPANYGSTSNPNVLLNLTDTGGAFANVWFFASDGTQAAMLEVGIAALLNNKHVEVGCDPPVNNVGAGIGNFYLLTT
jgi:hypothetical protein